jgi:hypothetical protein
MSILRKASAETTKVMLDDQDFLVLRSDISKREFNDLASNMPAGADDGKMSMTEALAAESANAVDEAIAKHFESLIPSSAEGK